MTAWSGFIPSQVGGTRVSGHLASVFDRMIALFTGRWAPSALVVLAGLAVFIWKVEIVLPIRLVGLVDPAAYAEMASSLLSGRGLDVDYISMHFRKFSPDITHPEETWPPFYSFLIVPFFAFMGKTAFAAKLPSLLISCFGLPLLTFCLAKRVIGSRMVAVVSAFSILLSCPVFHWSLYATADITFGFLVALAVLLALKGFEDSRWFLPMGAVLACAYYAKGSALVIFPAFVIYYILRRLQDRLPLAWTRRDVHFCLGILLILMLLLPWFIRNTVYYGDPLYCTHKHVAGYVGREPWEEHTYGLYWEKEPPSIRDKLDDPGELVRTGSMYFLRQLRLLFLKMDDRIFMFPDTPLEPFSFRDISTYWMGIPALLGIGLYGFAGILRILARLARGATRVSWASRASSALMGRDRLQILLELLRPFTRPGYGLFLLVGLSLVTFLTIFWVPTSRYTTPIIPFMILIGWATSYSVATRVLARLKIPRRAAGAVILGLFTIWALHERQDLLDARAHRGYPWAETGQAWMDMGEWIKEHARGSVTMTRNPWGLHFYSGEKAVQIPYGPLEEVFEAARYYGVTHLIPDPNRPALLPWVRGAIPGLRPVHGVMHVVLFEIDYDAIPTGPGESTPGR